MSPTSDGKKGWPSATCKRPDRDVPKLVCGYPLPCPYHTVVVEGVSLAELAEAAAGPGFRSDLVTAAAALPMPRDGGNPHEDCSRHEPCEAKDPARCPREPGRRLRRDAAARRWSALEVRRETGGLRHYLDGKPVHCGTGLLLQVVEERYDPDDAGYDWPLDRGVGVRYEASQDGKTIRATLHAGVAGYGFVAVLDDAGMRFRWPPRTP